MEVCIASAFFYPYQGGIETQLYEMIKRLHQNKFDIKVLSLVPKQDIPRLKEFPYAECVPVNAIRINLPKFSPPPVLIFSPMELKRKFERECSSIKIVHTFNDVVGYSIYSGRTNNVFIHSQHNVLKDGTDFFLWRFITNSVVEISKRYMQRCSRVVAVSRHAAKELKDYCDLSKDKIKVIPNGLDLKKFEYSKRASEEFRKEMNLDRFFIFAAGRIVKEKGFQNLIRAISIMENKDKVILGIGGEGYYKKELTKLSRDLDVKTVFFGFLRDEKLTGAFSACDVFVTPSLVREPFGMVNIEAMSFEKPVIASSVGGIPEIVDDNITGLLYDPYDYKELAKKLEILYNDKKLRLNFGKNGRKKVERKYSWDVLVKEWIEFYKTLI